MFIDLAFMIIVIKIFNLHLKVCLNFSFFSPEVLSVSLVEMKKLHIVFF